MMGSAGATPTGEGPWRSRVRPCLTVCSLPWPGKDPAAVRAARHPAPPTLLYPSGEKTQEPRAGAHGMDAPSQYGGPWPCVTALRGRMPWHAVYEGTWWPRARIAHASRGNDTQRAVVREGGEYEAVSTAIEIYGAMDMAFGSQRPRRREHR
jgi:hypothetical protein